MNLTIEQVEQLQQDIITHCDGLDDTLITNLCQVVVNHYKGKSVSGERMCHRCEKDNGNLLFHPTAMGIAAHWECLDCLAEFRSMADRNLLRVNEAEERHLTPGVDYDFPPYECTSCGEDQECLTFRPKYAPDEIAFWECDRCYRKVDEYEGDDDETLEWEGDRFYNV